MTEQRTERVGLLLTKTEKKLLERAAKKMGVGLSTYIRVKVLEASEKG